MITCIILFYEDNTPFSLNIVKVKNAIRPLEGRFDWSVSRVKMDIIGIL